MNRFKKTITFSTFIAIILLLIFIFLLCVAGGDIFSIGLNRFLPPSYSKTEKFLNDNINELSFVTDELSKMNYERIKITNTYGYGEEVCNMEVKHKDSNFLTVPIPKELISSIEALFKVGIQNISFSGNYVKFTMWQNINESRGIFYSYAGTNPNGEQLIEVRKLVEDNWYYYVHNYEKSKELNPEKFV